MSDVGAVSRRGATASVPRKPCRNREAGRLLTDIEPKVMNQLHVEGTMGRNDNRDSRGRARVQTINTEESKTVQTDAHLADINKILKQYDDVGIVDHLDYVEGVFADVGAFDDYKEVMDQVRGAESTFMGLPSKIREVFNHDVAQWLDAAHDPEKRDAILAKLKKVPGGAAEAAAAAVESVPQVAPAGSEE